MIPPRLVLATANRGKLEELRALVAEWGTAEVLSLADFPGVSGAEETGRSYLENALAKAGAVASATGLPTLADDSGLEVLSLLGKPGVKSKRFAPNAAGLTGTELDAANNAELLGKLLGADEKRRRAGYTCVAVLLRRLGGVPEVFTGRCWGRILEAPQGTGGFGYDPLFWFEELGKTFAELTPEEKNRVSHRGEAFRQVAEALKAKPLG